MTRRRRTVECVLALVLFLSTATTGLAINFQSDLDAKPTEILVIDDPWSSSVKPGGATPEVMKSYAFIPTLLTYPTPGCWELTARLGAAAEVRIVRDLK